MRLSTKGEYASRAMLELSLRYGEGPLHIREISSAQHIPERFLEQILLLLKRAGYVRSRRGSGGGYRLARDPASISMAEVIRLLDGALAPVESVSRYFYEPTPISRNPRLLAVFGEIRDFVSDKMESTTFADLAAD